MEKEKSVWQEKRKEWVVRARELFLAALRNFAATLSRAADGCYALWRGKEEARAKKVQKALYALLFCGGVFSFSAVVASARFPLGIYPAGFALLAALGRTGKREKSEEFLAQTAFLISAFSGVLFSAVFVEKNALVYLLSYLLLFLTRAFFTGGGMDESVLARVTLSSVVALLAALLPALPDGFPVRQVFGAVSMGILVPILTYLICGFYVYIGAGDLPGELKSGKRVYLQGAFFTLSYLFLYALRQVQVLGISLPFVLAVILTLTLSRTKGAIYGAACGMIGGMALGSETAPALAVAGFFAGLFFEYSGYVAVTVSFVAACGYSMYAEGLESFGYFTADFLVALLLFVPLMRLLPKEEAGKDWASPVLFRRETVKSAKGRLKTMSDAFSSLSEVFYTVSDTMKKPSLSEVSRLVADCCAEHCSACSLSGVCWGKEHAAALDATALAATRLMSAGKVEKEDFNASFRAKCATFPALVALINRRYAEMNGSFLKNNKTRLLAGEYSSVSRLLKSSAGELDRELEYNPSLEGQALRALKRLGLTYRRVAVFGRREMKVEVYGVALDRAKVSSEQILRVFGEEFGCVFEGPQFLMFEESVVMRLRRARALTLECAKSGCTKKGETVSGDNAVFFETERDYFYTLICDGMGSGREAAFTSRLAAIFIEKLMHCATPKNVTLEMLNTFLMSKTDETFTTVDLLEVDLLSARAHFIKAGASPSYVLRGDRLHKIESRTPPAGVLKNMCAEQTAFQLQEGDFVILLSDGAGEGDWIYPLLSDGEFENAAALCECIFHRAKTEGGMQDDLSVSVVRVVNSK